MSTDLETMSLTEIIRLREQLSEVLLRRFERPLALAFTDVVGSTAYFAEFGDEAGRGLMQRHLDHLQQVLPAHEGRIVDTAGDGAFMCFRSVDQAVNALTEINRQILMANAARPAQHHLTVRAGIHWGPVLTDGVVVSGDAVNLCARVTSTGQPKEIRLTKQAFLELSGPHRIVCNTLPPAELKGIPRPVEMMLFRWDQRAPVPTWIQVRESGERIPLPEKPVITFGRLKEHHGMQANDIVLLPANPQHQAMISRWHFEIRHAIDGLQLGALSDQTTEVDGRLVPKGTTAPVKVGSVVVLAGVMTLEFHAAEAEKTAHEADRHTVMLTVPPGGFQLPGAKLP
jgi:adenylate cyclase